MKELIIMTGNIGSGKSLVSSKYAKMGYVVVNMDAIQTMIGGGEYGLYDIDKKDIYNSIENVAISTALSKGFSVVIDRTNMDRKRRSRYIELGRNFGALIVSMDFTESKGGLERRIKNSYGIPSETWIKVHEAMFHLYEEPSIDEGFDELREAPIKFKFYAFDFDGTIVKNEFPNIGPLADNDVLARMKHLWKDLSNIIIISSCRSGDYENQMRDFLLKQKIPFDFINENPLFDTGSRKIFAHEYYDDRNRMFVLK